MNRIISRLLTLKRQLVILWWAFWHPSTPLYLKTIMVAIVVYVISPFDLVPDFLVGLGIVDDILLVAIAMNWLVSKLPKEVFFKPENSNNQQAKAHQTFNENNDAREGETIDGTSRRV